jgi:integrase
MSATNSMMLEKYNACSLWLEQFNSQSTKKSYAIHLSLFCRFHGTNPDTLIQLKPEQLTPMIVNYVLHLKKVAKQTAGKAKSGEICVNSVKTYLSGIQSFFMYNDMVLNWKKIIKYCPEPVTNNLRSYTKEEIIKLLSLADPRDRCLILLMVSTGMRVGAIKTLRKKHLTKLDESNIGILIVYAESKRDCYNTPVTPECMAAIDEYLEYRRKQCEKITDESFLIRNKFATLSRETNRPKPLLESVINKQMKFLLRKAGLPFDELQPDHSLRKFFNTALMNSDVSYSFKELLMGRHKRNLDRVYYDANNDKSREKIVLEYMKAVDALTINEEYRLKKKISEYEEKIKEFPKVEQLQAQLANRVIEEDSIKRQLEQLQKEKESENTKHETEMQTMKEQMSQIMSLIQQNPKLLLVKSEALLKKEIVNH